MPGGSEGAIVHKPAFVRQYARPGPTPTASREVPGRESRAVETDGGLTVEQSAVRIGRLLIMLIPELDLIPGTAICLHLPPGSAYLAPDLKNELVQLAACGSNTAVVAAFAESRRGIRERFRPQTSIEWLASAAGISNHEAMAIICGFGIGVRPVMAHNAGDPLGFLSVAAALAQKRDVLIYETVGMSPRGIHRLHEYVAEHGSNVCAVHVSYSSVNRTGEPSPRICPPTARCVELG